MTLKINEEGMGWTAECDCGEIQDIMDAPNKAYAARIILDDGWRFVRVGTSIKHLCPQCAKGAENDKKHPRR